MVIKKDYDKLIFPLIKQTFLKDKHLIIKQMKELEEAKKVLLTESKALENASKQIDKNFLKALDILGENNKKVILCGIGKSGHVAKKLSATFCSVGTTASFLHASEAVHGDLGIHQKDDPVIFFSNSSSTPELLNLIPILKKRGAKIVGILGNKNGPLVNKVDVFLNASVEKEADPLGIVPTASFMVATSIGHALAICLMKRKSFSENDYAKTHPAGQLGRNLLFSVKDVMHTIKEIPQVACNTSVRELVFEMTKKPMGAACVVKNQKLLGFVTDGDLRRGLTEHKDFLELETEKIMTTQPQTIYPSISLGKALDIMEGKEKKISVLPVLDPSNNNLIGMLRLHDIYSPQSST